MKKRAFLLFMIMVFMMSGCGETDKTVSEGAVQRIVSSEKENSEESALVSYEPDSSGMFSNRDFEVGYDESESAYIQLNGNTAVCSSDAVQISGSTVTIIDEGTYILSGTLDDGMIIVKSEKTDKTQLVLKDVTIHSETGAPIYILKSDKVFITTAAGTVNTLSNGGTFTAIDENNIDAVIYSKEDVTLNGAGTLVITSPGGHGIVSKDSLTITSGDYDINCAAHALAGKDDVCIAGGDFTIVSGKDGIHAENDDDAEKGFVYLRGGTYSIASEGDGISSGCYVQIEDGVFDILSGGGSENAAVKTSEAWGDFMGGGRHPGGRSGNMRENPRDNGKKGSFNDPKSENFSGMEDASADSTSIKGIKAETQLTINGGTFTINSADDAVHSNKDVTVNGGTFEIKSGDDAFHAENSLTVTKGTIHIYECYEGLEALHVAVSGGDITLVADDDGLNAAGGTDASGNMDGRDGMFGGRGMRSASNGSITISGGNIDITAYGDGLDANGSIDITGGFITVCGPSRGDTATLDYDSYAAISGGTFIGTGASGMAYTFSSSEQGVIAISVGNQAAGTEVRLTDSDGNTVMAHTPKLEFSVVILSSPELMKGEIYTIHVGSASGEFTAN